MKFDRNIIEFPTMLHRDIYMRAIRMVSPQQSFKDPTDFIMAQSGYELYNFMLFLYGAMYCDPNAYGMTPGAYEAFAAQRRWSNIRLRVKDALDYYDLSNAQISSYSKFVQELARYCNLSDDICYLTYSDFDKIKDLKRVFPVKLHHLLIPTDIVIQNLEKLGLYFRDDGEKIRVICEKYPNMFLSAAALAKAVDNTVKNPISKKLKYYFGEYIDTLEFRLIKGPYFPDLDYQIRHLSDEDRNAVIALDNLAKEYKLHSDYKDSQIGFEYTYKGKFVMGVWVHGCYKEPNKKHSSWIRCIRCRVAGPIDSSYLEKVYKSGEDFKRYFIRHLNLCTGCTPKHLSDTRAIKNIFGKNFRFCSTDIAADINDFSIQDIPYIKKYIEFRIKALSGE